MAAEADFLSLVTSEVVRVDHNLLYGLALGFPQCCIDAFSKHGERTARINKATEIIRRASKGLVYVPCSDCADAIVTGDKTEFFTFTRTGDVPTVQGTLRPFHLAHLNPAIGAAGRRLFVKESVGRSFSVAGHGSRALQRRQAAVNKARAALRVAEREFRTLKRAEMDAYADAKLEEFADAIEGGGD